MKLYNGMPEEDFSHQQTIKEVKNRILLLQQQLKQKDLSYEERLRVEKLLKQKQNFIQGIQ